MKNTLLILSSLMVSSLAFAGHAAHDCLVRDERGHVVLDRNNQCVLQEGTDPEIGAAACNVALGRVARQRTEARKDLQPTQVNAYFDSNEANLDPSDAQRIGRAADRAGNTGEVVVKGYTDFRGGKRLNENLAKQRAEAAKKVLVRNGVPNQKIQVEAQAPAAPKSASPCASLTGKKLAACLSNDRKVEVQVQAR